MHFAKKEKSEKDQNNVILKNFSKKVINFLLGCITDNTYVDMILDPMMLEVSLRNVWSLDGEDFQDKTLSNK